MTSGRLTGSATLYSGPIASVKQIQVTFDWAEPERVVCFWCEAPGYVRVRLLPADGDNESCLVMQDIEGNEFCLD